MFLALSLHTSSVPGEPNVKKARCGPSLYPSRAHQRNRFPQTSLSPLNFRVLNATHGRIQTAGKRRRQIKAKTARNNSTAHWLCRHLKRTSGAHPAPEARSAVGAFTVFICCAPSALCLCIPLLCLHQSANMSHKVRTDPYKCPAMSKTPP